jgi:peptidyl-prolyl cis-trans isomerase D
LEESREEIVKMLRESKAREALAKDIETLKVRAIKGEHLQTLAKDLAASLKMLVW